MHLVHRLSGRGDRLANEDPNLLPEPDVFRAGQADRDDRDARADGEMGEAFLEREDLTLAGPKVPLRKQRLGTAALETPVYLPKELAEPAQSTSRSPSWD